MARGCDGLMYFRYRGATKGAEQFCYGILDADNVPRRRFYEVQDFFKTIREYEDVLSSPVKSDICILYDYDSLASFRIQKQSLLLDCETEMKRIHKVFYDANQMVDVIDASSDFSDYKIVVVPNMIITDESFLNRLKQYVKDGGCAVVTYRTAVKDRDNNLTFGKVLPVDCDDLLGIYIDSTESVQEYDCIPLKGKDGASSSAGIFRDMITATTADTLYSYDDDFYRDYSAVTVNEYGDGYAYYIGTTPCEETLKEVLLSVMQKAGIEPVETPSGVELVERRSDKRCVKFAINHNAYSVNAFDMEFKPFEVKIISES